MANPYGTKAPEQFWRNAVATLHPNDVSPIPVKRFDLTQGTQVATAGSCFAQHLAQTLQSLAGIGFLQTEPSDPGQPLFSAAFGNIYTVAQLRQLFDEAFSIRTPPPAAWIRADERWVDGYRPTMFADGFADPESVFQARGQHLRAVRRMFTDCAVFVFTLGLTEGWLSTAGDAVFPLPPGLVTGKDSGPTARFHNFSYQDIWDDLSHFVDALRGVNPAVRIILTVSPVPLTATYTDEHVLVANTFSKSVLRAVCGQAEQTWPCVYYFPSFEIISGHYNNGGYYEPNKRTIAPSGVAHVMRVFRMSYLRETPTARTTPGSVPHDSGSLLDRAFPRERPVICDEEQFGTNVGF